MLAPMLMMKYAATALTAKSKGQTTANTMRFRLNKPITPDAHAAIVSHFTVKAQKLRNEENGTIENSAVTTVRA